MAIDVATVRKDFPIFDAHPGLHYLDSAASSQKPKAVIDAMSSYYETTHANVHRGVYAIAQEADARYEAARRRIAQFIGAPHEHEVLFTKNVTEAINLVAGSWGRANLRAGDAIVLTEMEHHSNIVPWQILQQELGFEIRWLRVCPETFVLDLSSLEQTLDGAKLLSVTGMSNVLGTMPPLRQLTDAARAAGAISLVDAAQYVPHLRTDVGEIGADLVAFTGHKMLGPTGIGVLWGRESLLDEMPPFLGGGGMIREVRLEGFTPEALPHKFEAGTPPIAEAIGLGVACDELDRYGMDAIWEHERAITQYALDTLRDRFGDDVVVHGPRTVEARGGVLSLGLKDLHPHDITQVLDQSNVCVRAGHHCAKPLMKCLGVGAVVRASFYVYNDTDDVDALADALAACADFFAF
ncbi:MAG TPA: SufS family cysteine desulfurase [Acidimicrobiales bacterium]|nr:SufS family cysteine desulfurase [Acidimicrobiales bacterium]